MTGITRCWKDAFDSRGDVLLHSSHHKCSHSTSTGLAQCGAQNFPIKRGRGRRVYQIFHLHNNLFINYQHTRRKKRKNYQSWSDTILQAKNTINMRPRSKIPLPVTPVPLPQRLPELPVPPAKFLHHIQANPDVPVRQLLEPFIEYEAALRAYFAQAPDHQFVKGDVNLVSLFEDGNESLLKIRGRKLDGSLEEQEKYIPSFLLGEYPTWTNSGVKDM